MITFSSVFIVAEPCLMCSTNTTRASVNSLLLHYLSKPLSMPILSCQDAVWSGDWFHICHKLFIFPGTSLLISATTLQGRHHNLIGTLPLNHTYLSWLCDHKMFSFLIFVLLWVPTLLFTAHLQLLFARYFVVCINFPLCVLPGCPFQKKYTVR